MKRQIIIDPVQADNYLLSIGQVGCFVCYDAEKRRIADICGNVSENLQCHDFQHLFLRLMGLVLPAMFAFNPMEKLGVIWAAES